MIDCLSDRNFFDRVQQYGSPLNLISADPMTRNAIELTDVATQREIDFELYFARKANKCLTFVDEAVNQGVGIDTASENEVLQSLDRGANHKKLICTAAVKSRSLLQLCVRRRICVVIDNLDELSLLCQITEEIGAPADIAIRLSGFDHQGAKLQSRFGFDVQVDQALINRLNGLAVNVVGVQFHLDGYDAGQRVSGIIQSLQWIELLRDSGHRIEFLDIGGGFPVCYLEQESQWRSFWRQLNRSLCGARSAITYRRHAMGLSVHEGKVVGEPNTYPFWQRPSGSDWLSVVLDQEVDGRTISSLVRHSGLQLRCEPGRSLMDGCGMTAAVVEFRKQNADGDWLIGLSMNRTQCRTSSDDFLVDPIAISNPVDQAHSSDQGGSMSGYLVGAYCTESELLSLRRLHFPYGIKRGDLVVFPNTAGYLMHFLESRSHQFPLARNLVHQTDRLDPIDN